MSRQGPEAIEKLAEESEIHRNFLLPTLPVQPASQQYEANFRATMGIVGKKTDTLLSKNKQTSKIILFAT